MDDSLRAGNIRRRTTRKDLKITFIITTGILHVFSIKYTNMIDTLYASVSTSWKLKITSKLPSALILYKYTGVNKEYDIELMPDPIYFRYKSQCFQLLSTMCMLIQLTASIYSR